MKMSSKFARFDFDLFNGFCPCNMTFSELKILVKQGENLQLEFKKKADHPEKIVRELVAFANSKGGILLLGVEDNGVIAGLKYPEEEKYVIEAALAKYSKPEIKYQLISIPVENGKEVLAYKVSEGIEKPYFWRIDKEKDLFKVYVRHRDQCLQASVEMFKILKTAGKYQPKPLQFKAKELLIFQYLEENKTISLAKLSALIKIPRWMASKILVQWVNQGILSIEPGETEDNYRLSPAFQAIPS